MGLRETADRPAKVIPASILDMIFLVCLWGDGPLLHCKSAADIPETENSKPLYLTISKHGFPIYGFTQAYGFGQGRPREGKKRAKRS